MKTLDGILILIWIVAILIGAGFIFTGAESDVIQIMEQPLDSLWKRTLGYGLIGGLMLYAARFFMYALFGVKAENPSSKNLLISSLIICLICALAGAAYFVYLRIHAL